MSSSIIQHRFPSTPFHCFRIGVSRDDHRPNHTHDIHELLVCLNSRGSQFFEQQEIPQHRGDVFFFPSGMPHHASGETDSLLDVFVIMVPDSLFSPESFGDRETYLTLQRMIQLAWQGRNPIPVSRGTGMSLLPLARRMVRNFTAKSLGYQTATRLCLQELFMRLMRDATFGEQAAIKLVGNPSHDAIARVLQHVDSYFTQDITVDRMAAMACMSRSHFHAVFREVAGCTLIDYATRVRVRAALRLLQTSDMSIAQIALDCGFASISRFYLAFKTLTGKTPRAIRNGH
ncbi:MAG: helix-turn-helix transcriptional regulator [Phycisphaeraceae bacterium]|nr:helix-turn-helix transcriptional regulator [Phycisphaeraceae bacterium]